MILAFPHFVLKCQMTCMYYGVRLNTYVSFTSTGKAGDKAFSKQKHMACEMADKYQYYMFYNKATAVKISHNMFKWYG